LSQQLTIMQIARAKKIIEQHGRRIELSKLGTADAVLVHQYVFSCSKETSEEAVAHAKGEFKGDVVELD